jgi:RNA polymerase sigma factor (sigma-70 family)
MNEWRTDFELLREFTRRGDQQAFATVVRRHIDLVYATALRKVEDQGGAEEVAQNVFATLARKAWQFAPDDSLPGWLYRTTLLEAKEWLRGELRRRRREQTAAELGTTMKDPHELSAFRALLPLLDEALLSLRERDRAALLLRFHEGQSLREVGLSFGVSEDAAQKRVASALEQVAQFFQRRGFRTATIVATTAALQHTTASASASTVSVVLNTALQAAPPALAGVTSLLARVMGLTKAQKGAVLLVLVATPLLWHWNAARVAEREAAQRPAQFEVAAAPTQRAQASGPRRIGAQEPMPAGEEFPTRTAANLRPESQDTIHVTGIIDLPECRAAAVEIRFSVMVRSNAVLRTNHMILKEGQSDRQYPFRGTNLVFEIRQIDSDSGSVKVRENGLDAEYALEGPEDNRASPSARPGGKLTLRLRNADLAEVLELYAEFIGRTVLCHPAIKRVPFNLSAAAVDQAGAAREVERVLKERGISTVPDGDTFEFVVPTELARSVLKAAGPPPRPATANDEVVAKGTINFKNLDLFEVLQIYAELNGRKWPSNDRPPGSLVFLHSQTPLTKAEVNYAIETLVGWQGLKIVPAGGNSFRSVRIRGP